MYALFFNLSSLNRFLIFIKRCFVFFSTMGSVMRIYTGIILSTVIFNRSLCCRIILFSTFARKVLSDLLIPQEI
jgi:hypothetical protein